MFYQRAPQSNSDGAKMLPWLLSVRLARNLSAVDVDEIRSLTNLQSDVNFLIRIKEFKGFST